MLGATAPRPTSLYRVSGSFRAGDSTGLQQEGHTTLQVACRCRAASKFRETSQGKGLRLGADMPGVWVKLCPGLRDLQGACATQPVDAKMRSIQAASRGLHLRADGRRDVYQAWAIALAARNDVKCGCGAGSATQRLQDRFGDACCDHKQSSVASRRCR